MLFDFLNKEGLAYLVNKILKRDVDLTQAEYDALPESKNSDGKNYYIYDSDITATAEEVGFDGSASGSTATNSQQALDELFADTKKLNENLEKVMSKIGSNIFFTFSNTRTGVGYYSNSIYALTDITIDSANIIGGTSDNMAPHIKTTKSGNYLYLYTSNADLAGKTVSCVCSFV